MCSRKYARALGWTLAMVAINGAVFLVLQNATSGEFFRHLFVYLHTEYVLSNCWALIMRFARHAALALVGCVAGIPLLIGRRGRGWHTQQIALLFYCLLVGAAIPLTGYTGASLDYFWELSAVVCILAGSALGVYLSRASQSGARLNVVLCACAGIWLHLLYYSDTYARRTLWPWDELLERDKLISKIVRETPGDVIAEDVAYVLLNGKRVVFDPGGQICTDCRRRWDFGGFYDDVNRGRYRLMILDGASDDVGCTRIRFPLKLLRLRDELYDLVLFVQPGAMKNSPQQARRVYRWRGAALEPRRT